MDREILCKAKRTYNGEWVEGYYVYFEKRKNACIYHFRKGNPLVKDVDPETRCRCTGVPDKNGNMIFENDIVKREILGETIVGQVVWLDIGFCGFQLKYKNSYHNMGKNGLTEKSEDEVIGNIFDNPELLEVDSDD